MPYWGGLCPPGYAGSPPSYVILRSQRPCLIAPCPLPCALRPGAGAGRVCALSWVALPLRVPLAPAGRAPMHQWRALPPLRAVPGGGRPLATLVVRHPTRARPWGGMRCQPFRGGGSPRTLKKEEGMCHPAAWILGGLYGVSGQCVRRFRAFSSLFATIFRTPRPGLMHNSFDCVLFYKQSLLVFSTKKANNRLPT